MGFGIIRARNLSEGSIGSTDVHNARRYKYETDYPKNIKPNGKHESKYLDTSKKIYLGRNESNLKSIIDQRIKNNNVKGIRKNSNLAIEYVCTINDKKAWENYSFDGFVSNTKKWLEDRHGKDSVVAVYNHLDESNPHAHIIVVPLVKKEVKWKNQSSSGVRTEVRLDTRKYTGGREKLRQLQDDYFSHLCQAYGQGKDNKLGVPLYRGTLVEDQHQTYVQQTNHAIGELRNKLEKEKDEIRRMELKLEIMKKKHELEIKEIEAQKVIKKHSDKSRKNWQNKGTRDNSEIFHTDKKDYRPYVKPKPSPTPNKRKGPKP